MRLLAAEGCYSSQMYASDINRELWDLGYDLFKDREDMLAKFIQADILNADSDLNQLKGQADIIMVNQVLHLFDWKKQVAAIKQIVNLSKPGSLVVGYQRAQVPAREVERPWGRMYLHDHESFQRIWSTVASETSSGWEVDDLIVDLSQWGMEKEDVDWMPEGKKGIDFAARRLY